MSSVEIGETQNFAACLALRMQVFVAEQGVPADLEQDEADATANHLLARVDGVPMGTARLLQAGDVGKIGRVCVLSKARGTGLGAGLMREGVALLKARGGISRIELGAQVDALGFYERVGFMAEGPVWDSVGIPHRTMVLKL